MKNDIVIARAVRINEAGHRYSQGRSGAQPLRVVFDPSVLDNPELISRQKLVSLVREADRDGRVVDVYEPWSKILSHRLAVVTNLDLAEQDNSDRGRCD